MQFVPLKVADYCFYTIVGLANSWLERDFDIATSVCKSILDLTNLVSENIILRNNLRYQDPSLKFLSISYISLVHYFTKATIYTFTVSDSISF